MARDIITSHTHSCSNNLSISIMDKIYNANIVLSIEHNGTIHVIKNRYGSYGMKSLDTIIDLMSRMLACTVFNGKLEIFQEGLKVQLVEAIAKVLIKEGGVALENSIQRKSIPNGIK